MIYNIEPMTKETAKYYARINTLAWVESYKTIINESFLNKINTDREINNTINKLMEHINDDSKRFLLKVDDEYVGLFRIGKTKYKEFVEYGELRAMYLLNKVKGNGYGKIMFEYSKRELTKLGYHKMVIGCLEKNSTNEFYKHMGCKFVKTNSIIIGKQELKENIYILDID